MKGAAGPLPLKVTAVPIPLKVTAVPIPLKGAAGSLPLKGLTPLTKIGFANASIPSPFPTKKRTSHERFVSTSGVRSEKPRVSDLAQ